MARKRKAITVLEQQVTDLKIERDNLLDGLFEALKPRIEQVVQERIEEALADVEITLNYQGA